MSRTILEILVGLFVILTGLAVAIVAGLPLFYLLDTAMSQGAWTLLHVVASFVCGAVTLLGVCVILSVSWFIGADIIERKDSKKGNPLCPK